MRKSWNKYFMEIAYMVASRGTCPRRQVGAVLVNDNHRIVSTGYNGVPKGMPHCEDGGCLMVEIDGKPSCIGVLHAESNAIDDAGRDARGCTLYTTTVPCFECAKRIINAGVTLVYYDEYYESKNTKLVEEYFEKSSTRLVQLEQ